MLWKLPKISALICLSCPSWKECQRETANGLYTADELATYASMKILTTTL